MAFKVFLTGATGYIGGTLFQALVEKHPEYEITILQRNPHPELLARYPRVKVVQGDYDSSDILLEAASRADCVVHCGDTDHLACLRSLVAGLLRRAAGGPGFLIQLSGTGIISDWLSPAEGAYGNFDQKIWSDVEDIDAIWSAPDASLHRPADKVLQEAFESYGDRLKTAVVCGPDIYGRGRGPGKVISILLPFFVEEAIKLGHTFYVGDGRNTRSWVHVTDLVKIHMALVESAARGGHGADWNRDGYYFASSQEIPQISLARATGKLLKNKGLIAGADPQQVSEDRVKYMSSGKFGDAPGIALFMLASNSRSSADRARKLFGYEPNGPKLMYELEGDVEAALDALRGSGR